jgi:hypothetical protein
MKRGIAFEKIWFDNDMVELCIHSSDGMSFFANKVYAAHQTIDDLIGGLDTFKNQVYGGIYDILLGQFGPEYASGAFQARLHFQDRGKIYVTVNALSEFEKFGIKNVASEAVLYIISEPALLDNFITELKEIKVGRRNDARLEGLIDGNVRI